MTDNDKPGPFPRDAIAASISEPFRPHYGAVFGKGAELWRCTDGHPDAGAAQVCARAELTARGRQPLTIGEVLADAAQPSVDELEDRERTPYGITGGGARNIGRHHAQVDEALRTEAEREDR
jgi:hypothetical protein